ncbi:MAG: peptidylprolyl isomerase [Planctomycetes bacterium]|nr:peptidylprolyl isomerase [Planctomycetota bacterium]
MNASSIALSSCFVLFAASACSTPKSGPVRATPSPAAPAEQSAPGEQVAPGAQTDPAHPVAVAAPEVPVEQALGELAILEDARHPSVAQFATHDSALVRARAARALGRVLDAAAEPLAKLLDDADASVRAEAAFALGMRGDAGFADALLARADARRESDANVRARAVEAASKLSTPEKRSALLTALADADPRVRIEAAQAPSRWPTTEKGALDVDRALIAHLEKETDADVITYALFALERRKGVDAVATFLRFATAQDSRHRIYSVRGLVTLLSSHSLGMLDATAASAALLARTDDHDSRVACEAVPVFKTSVDEEHVPAYSLGHESANVRYSTWRVVGDWIPNTRDQMTILGASGWILHEGSGALVDYESSPFVWAAGREAQLRIYARLLTDPEAGVPAEVPFESLLTTQPLPEDDVVALAGIARGLQAAPAALFDRVIPPYLRHRDPRVASAAIESLAKHLRPDHRQTLHELLYSPDNGLRLAALGTLDTKPDASDLEHVAASFASAVGDIAPEVRFNALRLAGKIGGAGAIELLAAALGAPEPFVRSVARQELQKLAPAELAKHDAEPTKRAPSTPVRAIDLPARPRHPIVEVHTKRGVLRFELFPDEAPFHVHNFLTLAARGYYDGLGFHRVVPDFVIQGGDYRGDGNGGTTFRIAEDVRALHAKGELVPQDSLRHEIGPRKYVRGSLGMPRNEDLESGGSQFFVTHRETPHLDGRYTIFGELRDGFEALDRIEVGDVIERVTVVDDGR